jgi:site-specific recombinase XerC
MAGAALEVAGDELFRRRHWGAFLLTPAAGLEPSARFGGIKWISSMGCCTSGGSRTACRACPLGGGELRALHKLQREAMPSRYVFTTERRAPMSPAGFRKMLARTGEAGAFPFPVHPHMLRHACGYKLANDGQDTRALQHYLGHKNIQHTVRYTELAADRFKSFWED